MTPGYDARAIDASHDPELACWVESAARHQREGGDFPIQNLPFGVFRRRGAAESFRPGVAIGDEVLDLWALEGTGALASLAPHILGVLRQPSLDLLLRLAAEDRRELRLELSGFLAGPRPATGDSLLVPQREVEFDLPARIGDYTDFYASIHHATNVGRLFRPDNPLLPNYKHIPIGYHGRASSIVPSGTAVRRPVGQRKPPDAEAPVFEASRLLDYELEVGVLIAGENELGEPVPIERAEERIFGLCLVNDWSARDLQAWEYQPLGPFLSKSFATSISPWVVTLEALAPFRAPAFARPADDPAPLPYLSSPENTEAGGIDLSLEVWLRPAGEVEDFRLSRGSFRDMYWTVAQLVTHHASNGCNLRPGDLLASGTVSGPEPENRGCLLEITRRGQEPVELPGGGERKFLEDGDEVILRGFLEREGRVRLGLGECRGVIQPASRDA